MIETAYATIYFLNTDHIGTVGSCGQVQQGDHTAEGRMTEQISALYTKAYSPGSVSTCLDLR